MTHTILTPYQCQYYAWMLTRHAASDSVESLASTLVNSQIDLNPHQVDAALFACRNPLSRGVILADEVGLGKTIEAGLVISQRWAEHRKRILIIVPANLRKQWHQELHDKFGLSSVILESKNYNSIVKKSGQNPFLYSNGPVICSYQFAKSKAEAIKSIDWDLVVMDEAHRMRNVYKTNNVIAKALQKALEHVGSKVLLTATPLQNSLLELYGLVSMIDERVFGDIDSFRIQFNNTGQEHTFKELRARVSTICKRTLRRQVQQFVPYTARHALVEEFTPSADEKLLSALVSDYLRRPNLQALPNNRRKLISLVLWKLLASSTHAIAGALETMANRLQSSLDNITNNTELSDELSGDFEALGETSDEWDELNPDNDVETKIDLNAIRQEISDLRQFISLATSIRDNAKGKALLTALGRAFSELEKLGADKKAIIFTESRKTQDYLYSLLEGTPYAGGVVLFNGTNGDSRAQEIYKVWLIRHQGTDRISGSKSADTRAALVDHFKDSGTVMIATEAGAEGINLQFCSLVVNFDLPWNPQRIEQRIGRCHRYGQKHDVVVVNFVDRSNEADARVYELLAQKFKLFEGVFGASDEVLGAIGSGVDFERRIADIYQDCRDSEAIKASFEQLQNDLSEEISEEMIKARQLLLENFDEEVQDRLKISDEDSRTTLNRYEKMLIDLTKTELGENAEFDQAGFILKNLPSNTLTNVELGRYELPRRSKEAHLYRLNHPLALWITEQAKNRDLPNACLTFDYSAYGAQISTLKQHRGKSGQLTAALVCIDSLGQLEEYIIISAITSEGIILEEDDPEKLLRFPSNVSTLSPPFTENIDLKSNIEMKKHNLLRDVNQRNFGYFEQEVEKLEAWADDMKVSLEQEIKNIDLEIKAIRRAAATAATLEDKLVEHKRQREYETKRSRLRRELFQKQDEIEEERNKLISDLEIQLKQDVNETELFTIRWELI